MAPSRNRGEISRSSGRRTYPAAGVLDDPVESAAAGTCKKPSFRKGTAWFGHGASVATLGDTGSAAIFKKERSRGIEIAKVG